MKSLILNGAAADVKCAPAVSAAAAAEGIIDGGGGGGGNDDGGYGAAAAAAEGEGEPLLHGKDAAEGKQPSAVFIFSMWSAMVCAHCCA